MRVIEETIEVRFETGTAEAFLYRPGGAGSRPGILHLTDIWGIRTARKEMARRQAAQGYAVLLPNIFWRATKLPLFDFTPQSGDARTMARLGELRAAVTPAQMTADSAVYLDFLGRQANVRPGRMGVAGYCFTGAMAMRAAAVRPDVVAAAASFHGGGLATDTPDSPHLLLAQITARLYFGHAIEDRSMPAAMIEKLDAALKDWGGDFESEIYDGAHHGWTIPGPAYNAGQAERHFIKLMALFGERLA